MGYWRVHLCIVNHNKESQSKTRNTMKKQVKTLSLKTDKVVSLSKADLRTVQGGAPSSGRTYTVTMFASNSGQSYNC